ncbi:MAG: hypothetical protein ACREVC_11310 [Burkholderiales bacterium]
MSARAVVVFVAALGLVALSGCGERPQTASFHQGKYQGKPDAQPWNNAPLAYGSAKWTQGDKTTWEAEVKNRTQSQNEYVRIVH